MGPLLWDQNFDVNASYGTCKHKILESMKDATELELKQNDLK